MKCLVVGHLVVDRIVRRDRQETRIGGGAYYSALALARFCDVKILTSVGEDFPREWLEELESRGISVEVIPSTESTSYELRYLDGKERTLRLLSRAEPIENVDARGFDLVILNPVAGEIPPEVVPETAGKAFVSADVQGFIRNPKPGPVRLKRLDGSFLSGVKVLHADVNEFQSVYGLAPADVEVLLLSNGAEPGMAYLRGRPYRFRPLNFNVPESTGAGDVFLASFTYFHRECPFVQALKRAAAFTALFLSRRDFGFSVEEVGKLALGVSVEKFTGEHGSQWQR